jgi:subtilisin family serine protease
MRFLVYSFFVTTIIGTIVAAPYSYSRVLDSVGNTDKLEYIDSSEKYEIQRDQYKILFENGPVGVNDDAMSDTLDIDIRMLAQDDNKKRNCFILRFYSSADRKILQQFEDLMASCQGKLHVAYEAAVKGQTICFPDNELPLNLLKEIKWIKALERDRLYKASQVQANAPFGLARLSGANLPMNGTFGFDYTGKGVNVYIVDTDMNIQHPEFSGRASSVYVAPNLNVDSSGCSGHATEVASLAGGKTVGVAKLCNLLGVTVLDCNGDGYTSDIIAGLNWILANSKQPAVINMSLGGPRSAALDAAVSNVANKGYLITVAAGNENQNACNTSPGGNSDVISVGATTATDSRAYFSNYGNCVAMMAPGEDVLCASPSGGFMRNSGTSFASPYVAGVIALLYQKNDFKSSATAIREQLFNLAVTGKLTNLNGSPNILLQAPPYDNNTQVLVNFGDASSPPPSQPSPSDALTIICSALIIPFLLFF